MIGYPVHGELITDGNAATATVLVLYISGSTTVRTLAATEFLTITDILISTEIGGECSLAADDDTAGGEVIIKAEFAPNGGVQGPIVTPYKCPKGVMPKFKGISTGLDVCIIEGHITEA